MSGQVRSGQVRSGQDRSVQFSSGQIRSGQVRSGGLDKALALDLWSCFVYFCTWTLDKLGSFLLFLGLLLFLRGSASDTSGLVYFGKITSAKSYNFELSAFKVL